MDCCTFISMLFRSYNHPPSISKRSTLCCDKYTLAHIQGIYVYLSVDLYMSLHVEKFVCLIMNYLATKIETKNQNKHYLHS